MLILTRTEGGSLILTVPPSSEVRQIQIKVLEFSHMHGKKPRVVLGTHAPREIGIQRSEGDLPGFPQKQRA